MGTGPVERRAGQSTPAAYAAGIFLFVLIAGCVSPRQESAPPPTPTEAPQTAEPPSAAPTRDTGTPAKTPAFPESATAAPQKPSPTPGATKPATKPANTLDLAALEKRLHETAAIGVFTKIALKNQVDDLVNKFRALHQRRGEPTQLRQSYDLLFLKVLTLLQDDDPPLAKTIVASREAIWEVLADPVKFSTL